MACCSFERVAEPPENLRVVLAEHRRARRRWRSGGHLHQRAWILETSRDRMIDLDERVACAQMRMMCGLRHREYRANGETETLPLADEILGVVLQQLLADHRAQHVVVGLTARQLVEDFALERSVDCAADL